MITYRICSLVWIVVFVALTGTARAYVQVELPLEQLPQEHDYQKTLRNFMATLTEKDFEVERKEIKVVPTDDPDELYRMWLMSLHMHPINAANLPASGFTLKSLESGKSLVLPCAPNESQMLAWLSAWDYAGNTYRGMRALQLRAF